MSNTKAIEAWVGANNESAARLLIETKHPEIKAGMERIVSLRETISGMWSYRIELSQDETPTDQRLQSEDVYPVGEEGAL